MTFYSLPFTPERPEATEARLEKIYEAAKFGLKGDSLALASGLTPAQYRRLHEFDPLVEMAEQKVGQLRQFVFWQCPGNEKGHSEKRPNSLILWGDGWGSNPRPPESQSGALPTELPPPLNWPARQGSNL